MENEVLEFDIGLGSVNGRSDGDDDDPIDIDNPLDDDDDMGADSSAAAAASGSEIYLPDGDLNDGRSSAFSNGRNKVASAGDKGTEKFSSGTRVRISGQTLSEDDMDKKIQQLRNEVERASRKCEVYRANLLSVLKDIEDHKLQLSINVQNIKISMKDNL
ncbi:unnamed protein product [Linum tenue]|uniref:Uncharacterized protein n=1 Tax=Linum tenue TaxID=586396 RepID=A0AAV0PK44_9ROSI|nr:unnamed protein product [Linum tenue]